jgi:hypothetical protein
MSLVSQLHSGGLGHWCADVLTNTAPLATQVQAAVRNVDPVRPTGDVDVDHWAVIGSAFSQRLCFATSLEPPYAAYFGAVHAGLLGAPALDQVHLAWPTHRNLPTEVPAAEFRPTTHGWLDVATEGTGWTTPTGPGRSDEFLLVFTRWLVDYLTDHALPGAIADTRDAEKEIARACWVLAGLENAYRGSAIPPDLANELRQLENLPLDGWPDYIGPALQCVLLGSPTFVTDELVRLVGRLQLSGSLAALRQLAGDPPAGHKLGIAQPTIVTRWAEGDILVGDTLLDVKTVINVKDPQRVARWLWQLLGYAWLDTEDHYGIRNVGLYLARHGVILTWPVDQLAGVLLNATSASRVEATRREFLGYAYDAMQLEGAVPFGAPPQRTRTA